MSLHDATLENTDAVESADVFVFPTSFSQERLWFLDRLQPGSPVYNMQTPIHLRAPLDKKALERSLHDLLRRHETLRTRFAALDGQPVQVIAPTQSLTVTYKDLRALSQSKREIEVGRLCAEDAELPFNLAQSPLLRATLLILGDQEQLLLLTMHHIISDLWSIGVLVREFMQLYESHALGKTPSLPPLPVQYADFAVWQRQQLQGDQLLSQLSYWKRQLAGAPTLLDLPSDRPRPATQSFRGAGISFEVPGPLLQAVKSLSRQKEVTPFMTLLATFATLLFRYTGQPDLLLGTPVAGRNRTELEGLIGFFVNTLVLRTDLSGNPSFLQLLEHVREVTLGAFAHQLLPFEKLVQELQPERHTSHNPLVQVMFVFQNVPTVTPGPAPDVLDLPKSALQTGARTAKFDLTLSLVETGHSLLGIFEYNTDLFDAQTIERMSQHFRTLLAGIVARPEQPLSDLPLLSPAEREQLLFEWNDTKTSVPLNQCVHRLFEAQVERTPGAIALVFDNKQLTYQELNARANQVGHYLRTLGIGPEACVGVCLERSLEAVIAILGVLKAGGAYVPLDPAYPTNRLTFMIEDAEIPVVLTQQPFVDALGEHTAQVVVLERDGELIDRQSQQNLDGGAGAGNLAYVIYTSGSTGVPKGVLLEHRGLTNLVLAQIGAFAIDSESRVLQFASLNFDASVSEIFTALLAGASLYLAPSDALLPGPALIQSLRSHLISTVTLPPAVLSALAGAELPALRTIISAGEACSSNLVSSWANGRRFLNAYGPTEATVCATIAECQDDGLDPPIGRPIANTQIYILDPHLQPVPVGVPGELYIGGIGLARGYLNQPELTAEKFIPNPFQDVPGARLYKSGDLARYHPDGNIQFLGRLDDQINLRGYRIETGEIEAALRQHAAIREAVVLALDFQAGNKRLVAFIVPERTEAPAVAELRSFLKEMLPDYLIPSLFVLREALPLTGNGKIDRQALVGSGSFQPEPVADYVAPETEVERVLATLWQELLELERVGVNDNFFDLGGHSLLILKMHIRLEEIFNIEFSMVELFKHPTIATLARFLAQERVEEPALKDYQERANKQRESFNRNRRPTA